MRIGEAAALVGTSTRTLRYYEAQGLLTTRREANGHRDFSETDVLLVREIRTLLDIGFGLEDTRPFVECLRSGQPTGDACPASVAMYRRKLTELDAHIARLTAARTRLADAIDHAEGNDTTRRPICEQTPPLN